MACRMTKHLYLLIPTCLKVYYLKTLSCLIKSAKFSCFIRRFVSFLLLGHSLREANYIEIGNSPEFSFPNPPGMHSFKFHSLLFLQVQGGFQKWISCQYPANFATSCTNLLKNFCRMLLGLNFYVVQSCHQYCRCEFNHVVLICN